MLVKLKQWLPIMSFSMAAFLLVTSELIPIGVLNQISIDLLIDPSYAGLMITVPSVIAALSALFFPFLTKQFDRKYIFLSLTVMMMVSNLIVYCCQQYYMILMGRLIIGIAIGGFATLSITSCRTYAPNENRIAIAISMVMAGMTLATVIGLPIGIWISHMFGWRRIFLILSSLSLVLFFTQLKWLRPKKLNEAADIKKVLFLIKSSVTRKYVFISLCIFLSHFFCYSYISVLFEQVFNLDVQDTVAVLCLFGVASALGNIISSRSNAGNVNNYLLFSFVLFCVSLAFVLGHNLGLLYIACVFWGLAFGVFSSAINIFIVFHSSNNTESAMPLFIALIQVTITLGSYLGSVALQYLGINSVVWCSLASFSMCTLFFIFTGLRWIRVQQNLESLYQRLFS
ncbi:MFS transporter [Pseudomonas coronafaciens pv. coronafaciens]|nr:MFS transporter [Pseudomonas coronafaciens pv. coronafaciens]